jgi:hypothetical protein
MAKIEVKLPAEFTRRLSSLAERTDDVVESVLKAGGEVVLEQVKSNLQSVIGRGTEFPSRSTGELVSSLGMSPVEVGGDGVHNIKVGFNEPRRKQYAAKGKRSYGASTNAMIANVMEYGRHGQPAKPFLKPAKSASKSACMQAMKNKLEEETGKI